MARTVITNFVINSPVRVRVAKADGDCMFVAGGKVYENGQYDGKWHKFPENTKFEVVVAVDKTDTYMLLAKEKVTVVTEDDEGNEKTSTKTKLIPVFLRRMSYQKLVNAAAPIEVSEEEKNADFGAPLIEAVPEPAPEAEVSANDDSDDTLLEELVSEVDELDRIENEGPTDEELADLEVELAVG